MRGGAVKSFPLSFLALYKTPFCGCGSGRVDTLKVTRSIFDFSEEITNIKTKTFLSQE
jgi:hypothetical protein